MKKHLFLLVTMTLPKEFTVDLPSWLREVTLEDKVLITKVGPTIQEVRTKDDLPARKGFAVTVKAGGNRFADPTTFMVWQRHVTVNKQVTLEWDEALTREFFVENALKVVEGLKVVDPILPAHVVKVRGTDKVSYGRRFIMKYGSNPQKVYIDLMRSLTFAEEGGPGELVKSTPWDVAYNAASLGGQVIPTKLPSMEDEDKEKVADEKAEK